MVASDSHSEEEIRLGINSGFDLMSRTDFEWEWETNFNDDYKYQFELSWEFTKKLQVLGIYDFYHGWNSGLRIIL